MIYVSYFYLITFIKIQAFKNYILNILFSINKNKKLILSGIINIKN